MDMTHLRSLLAVTETGAITPAAERLGLTQPALSRRLQHLEEHLGAELLSRGRKGVELTEIGKLVANLGIERIVLAMPSVCGRVQAKIIRGISGFGCEVHALPSFADLVANTASGALDTKPVDVNELLGRDVR